MWMLKDKKLLSILALIFFLSVSQVSATFISITTDINDLDIIDNAGVSNVTVRNLGDEAAFDVGLSFLLPGGFVGEDLFIGRLNPGEGVDKELFLSIEGDTALGVYPAALVVSYKDANSYPFSAISPFKIISGSRTTSNVFGVFDEVTLTGDRKEKLTLSIKSPDESGHDLHVRLYLPIELNAVESEKDLSIGSSSEGEVNFEVSSFSALPGSTYAVFASIAYTDDGLEHSAIARGIVRVDKEKPLFSKERLTFALIGLILIFVLYQFGASKWRRE
jgi:hypothetical protein